MVQVEENDRREYGSNRPTLEELNKYQNKMIKTDARIRIDEANSRTVYLDIRFFRSGHIMSLNTGVVDSDHEIQRQKENMKSVDPLNIYKGNIKNE